jgi:hypothetical protein
MTTCDKHVQFCHLSVLQQTESQRRFTCMMKDTQLHLNAYLNFYLLTPWSRVLLEKLTVNFAASQEIPRIYGTRKFLTVPTRGRH